MWQFPLLYQQGVQNVLFSWLRILSWMFNGLCSAVIIFFLCTRALEHQAFNSDGKTAGRDILGATMYSCVVWVVNLQMALAVSYFTLIQHLFIWGSISIWYIFLLIYGSMTPTFSTNAYHIFIEVLAPGPSYWFVLLFVVITTLIPYFSYSAIQMRFLPMYHQMILWIRNEGQLDNQEYCDIFRNTSTFRSTSVGSTARLAAKQSKLKERNQSDTWQVWHRYLCLQEMKIYSTSLTDETTHNTCLREMKISSTCLTDKPPTIHIEHDAVFLLFDKSDMKHT